MNIASISSNQNHDPTNISWLLTFISRLLTFFLVLVRESICLSLFQAQLVIDPLVLGKVWVLIGLHVKVDVFLNVSDLFDLLCMRENHSFLWFVDCVCGIGDFASSFVQDRSI